MYDFGEVCPISKAASVLCERWTLQIIREMFLGATRFTEFQTYLPKLSPTLLNSRLRTLENEGIILKKKVPGKSGTEYHLTSMGKALQPLMTEFGKWGMTFAFESTEYNELNPASIVRDFAFALDIDQIPTGDSIIQFNISYDGDLIKKFILIRDGKAQSCSDNPGHDVDVYLTAELSTLYKIWFGELSVMNARESEKLKTIGSTHYLRNISKWLRTSQFAPYHRNYQ
ncbi:MAG: helix-turn-helix transcriptional regulator, partial [Gammaproteobacteria bacterium]|nr:helix-turn-helix transcriptional regulator [Gammaproteobacteria bacterium]